MHVNNIHKYLSNNILLKIAQRSLLKTLLEIFIAMKNQMDA